LKTRRLLGKLWHGLGALQPAGVRFIRLGRYAYAHEPEVRYLELLVDAGSTVVDIGANAGQYAYTLSRLVGPRGCVICIEPLPRLGRLLRRASRQLQLPLVVESCALSDRVGMTELHVPVDKGNQISTRASLVAHGSKEYATIQVPIRRLDDITATILGRISLIKIDVEGHELAVLRGSKRTIDAHRPAILVEIDENHSHVPVEETDCLLRDMNYDKFYIDHDLNQIRVGYAETGKDISNNVYNFLFLPMESIVRSDTTFG
jgi:FkbM family methyltransferase